MSNIYHAPFESGAIGDTLTFTTTGTSTPQNVYTDPDLDTAWPNPVEADSEGNFPVIFLDPSLPDYRVDYKDINGVSYPGYPVDNVPASQDQSSAYLVKGGTPIVEMYESDEATDAKRWRTIVSGGVMRLQTGTDAGVWTDFMTVTRAGVVTIPSFVTNAGSFTGTLTGMSGTITGTFYWRVSDDFVDLWCDQDITGTSNDTAMTLTGLSAAIQPGSTRFTSDFRALDNTAIAGPFYAAISGSVVTFLPNFTSSGSKGLKAGWTIGYPL